MTEDNSWKSLDKDGSTPPAGGRAFLEEESRFGELSSSAQLLLLGTYTFGTRDQWRAAQADADDLAVPFVQPFDGSLEGWKNPDTLEALTKFAMKDHGSSANASQWRPGIPSRPDDQFALWRDVELTRNPLSALALISLSVWSESELQRVSASAAIHALTDGGYPVAEHVLRSALQSEDSLAAEVAAAALRAPSGESPKADAGEEEITSDGETSLTIHGTWARLAAERWYAPGSPLHSHIRNEASSNLFSAEDYFRWSGGYSVAERESGVQDFPLWKTAQGISSIDTVYAHSHGGNVALGRLSRGEKVRLLVLLHTPALPRSEEEWKTIRSNVGRVLIMRSRADLVMLADGLRNRSTLNFDQAQLPHRRVLPHWRAPDAWFSHSLFVDHGTWTKYGIANEVNYERVIAAALQPARLPASNQPPQGETLQW